MSAYVGNKSRQRLSEMNERAAPGPTIILPPYNYSSSPSTSLSDAGTQKGSKQRGPTVNREIPSSPRALEKESKTTKEKCRKV